MLWLLTFASVPLSVRLLMPALGTEVIFPAEPLLGCLAALNIATLLRDSGPRGSLRLLMRSHIGMIGLSWLALHAISAAFSSAPVVSWKSTFVQSIYVMALLPTKRAGIEELRRAWHRRRQVHDLAFLLVIAFALTWASVHGLDRMSMNFSAYPFYMDHTLYAAVICFLIFRFLGISGEALHGRNHDMRFLSLIVLTSALGVALVLSYSRAAWLGAATSLALMTSVRVGLKRSALSLVCLAILVWLLLALTPMNTYLAPWRAYASQDPGMGPLRTLLSVVNTRTDTNNRDRIIRWKASWSMFKERPLTGIGTGTWSRHYLNHLSADEAKQVHGPIPIKDHEIVPALRVGNHLHMRDHAGRAASNPGSAHSEYLLALSELGIGGIAWWLVVLWLVAHRTVLLLRLRAVQKTGAHTWAIGLALVAFLVHGAFNNFLDDCKASVLFWPSLALLLAPSDHDG